MKNLSRYFKDIEPGTICTGTIHFFGLDSKSLMKMGVIKKQEIQRPGAQKTNEYIFVDLPNPHEEDIEIDIAEYAKSLTS